MNKRNEIKILKARKEAYQDDLDIIFNKQHKLEERIKKLIYQLVEEEQLLSKAMWELQIQDDGRLSFYAHVRDFPELYKVCKLTDGWGMQLELNHLTFHEHDNEMYITIENTEKAIGFLNKYGIKSRSYRAC